jgi:hypothetical protein
MFDIVEAPDLLPFLEGDILPFLEGDTEIPSTL